MCRFDPGMEEFRRLLDCLGLSWQGYRRVRKGIKKRIRRHMQESGYATSEQYLVALEQDKELRTESERLMTVSISRFFRDRALWHALEKKILPDIIERNREKIRVWFAGCACGEEVFSFAILWDQLQGQFNTLPVLEALATDMNTVYLEKAKEGVFSRSSLKEVPDEVRAKYFLRQEGEERYRIMPLFRMGITWKLHNLLHDPPDESFDIIFLRNNLLTYYKPEISRPALQKIIACLMPGGYLVIGSHEKVPVNMENMLPFENFSYILQKKDRTQSSTI